MAALAQEESKLDEEKCLATDEKVPPCQPLMNAFEIDFEIPTAKQINLQEAFLTYKKMRQVM